MSAEPKHVYEWLDEPPANDAERDAKEWLEQFCKPAWKKNERWLARYLVTVEWRGNRYECSGASSMGDVWLRNDGSGNFYDHRVDVEELSNWKRTNAPKTS